MTLLSAAEDLQGTTLKAIAGSLRRLEYVCGLKNPEGKYEHWGLRRVYGEDAAHRALAEAHRVLLSTVLATPIRELEEDVRRSSEQAGISESEFLERLSHNRSGLLPASPGAGSGRHLNSVLLALSSLRRNRAMFATPQVLSQSQPPAQ